MLHDLINAQISGLNKEVSYLEINPPNRVNFDKIESNNKRLLLNKNVVTIKPAPDVFICEIESFFGFCEFGRITIKFDVIVTESHIELAKKYLNKDGLIMDFNGNILRNELDY